MLSLFPILLLLLLIFFGQKGACGGGGENRQCRRRRARQKLENAGEAPLLNLHIDSGWFGGLTVVMRLGRWRFFGMVKSWI